MTAVQNSEYAKPGEYGGQEMMTIAASRLIGNELALVGFGLPMIAATLAKFTHAPGVVMMTEAGIYDAQPEQLPLCVAEARYSYKTPWYGTPVEFLGMVLPTQRADVCCLGAHRWINTAT